MSADAVRIAKLKISMTTQPKGTGAIEKHVCSSPIYYARIDHRNCRSLNSNIIDQQLTTSQSEPVDPEDVARASFNVGDALSMLMKTANSPEVDTGKQRNTFAFSDDDDDDDADDSNTDGGDKGDKSSRSPDDDRLKISAMAGDMIFEPEPPGFAEQSLPLQQEFAKLRSIPIVTASQAARRTDPIAANKSKQKRGARYAEPVQWDIFMPNLYLLNNEHMLLLGTVEFSQMFKRVISSGRPLSHTERIFADISKNNMLQQDRVFLKMPLPGSKKSDGCRVIPFGMIPLVLHYLRPKALRESINIAETRNLFRKLYWQICKHFGQFAPPIVVRQLRQFAFNAEKSAIGSIGNALGLLSMRSGNIDADIGTYDEESSESSNDNSTGNAKSDNGEEDVDDGDADSEIIFPDEEDVDNRLFFSEDEEGDEEEEDDDEEEEEEEGISEGIQFSDDEEEEEEELDEEDIAFLDTDDVVDITPRPSSRSAKIADMRYAHYTDDELDALVMHHIDTLEEINQVRKQRRLITKPLREKMQRLDRERSKSSSSSSSRSLKRKRDSQSVEERATATGDLQLSPDVAESCPPPKRVAVAEEDPTGGESPKTKLRVYRMQSSQLITSLPEATAWSGELLKFMTMVKKKRISDVESSSYDSKDEKKLGERYGH